MAEFGEQLRKAREEKGMTQQSLAEKLNVTRQTVSRWENGGRYPDLLMIKSLMQVLCVNADYLLSDEEETERIVQRTSVIDNKIGNNITLSLFACVAILYFVSVTGIMLRIPSLLAGENFFDAWFIGGNMLRELIVIVTFFFGFFWVLTDSFSPKRAGVVLASFFAAGLIKQLCLLTSETLEVNYLITALKITVSILGIMAADRYFNRKYSKLWYTCIVVISVLGMFHAFYSALVMMFFAGNYVTGDTATSAILNVLTFLLFLYLAYSYKNRQKRAGIVQG